ncbi:MAG TPA: isoprenylcysteine carboxylmethyltransferase family protein [Sphingomonadales bacterium]|nr:isoprenylcysteine carboxylmethyltransferase family protein [Sphingomonadales bacterium]
MKRVLVLVYGLVCYLIFFPVFLYLFGFMADLWVPFSVSRGGEPAAGAGDVLFDLGLMALFGVQHSVMARPTFKRWWTRIVPKPAERSTFVLITSAILIYTYASWRPLGSVIWDLSGTPVEPVLWAVFAAGALVVLASSFMINHFDLFGLRQVWLYFQGRQYTAVPFRITGFYKWVRNPLMLGFLLAFWAAPVMTWGRLLYAGGMSLYIFIGMWFEERNIAEALGEPYRTYRASTSMILPGFRKAGKTVKDGV